MSALPEVAARRLLEREAELAEINGLFDRVRAGAGAVVVVEGPAGIGKSELLAAVGAGAQARGLGVLRARCSEFEEEIAFGVARQLFEPMLRAASAGERRRLLDGVARVGARALGVEPGEPPADRFAAIHGLFWLCANRAERGPLVLAVDDAQWVDGPSLACLGYVARRVGDLRLVVVLGLRSGDPGGERAELTRLVGDGVERLVLGGLSAAAVAAIVRSQLDEAADEEFCAACSELTGGNPLLVRELLAAARSEGLSARGDSVPALGAIAPGAVRPSVLARLGRLGGEAIALARAVAVLGSGAEVMLAARLAELDPVAAELTADRLAAAQILSPARPLEFFHPLLGAAVQEDMASGARRVAHRRAAELVDGAGDGSLARVAAHLCACASAGDGWVVARLREAAREALDRAAPEIAADYLRRALTEPPNDAERAALLFLLGTAEWRAGQPDAVAHLEQALAACGDDHLTLIATCNALAFAHSMGDRPDRAIDVIEQALATVGKTDAQRIPPAPQGMIELPLSDDARLALALESMSVIYGVIDQQTAQVAMGRAERLAGRLNALTDPPVTLLVVLAYCAARTNRADQAEKLAERALAYEPHAAPIQIGVVLMITLTMIERYDLAERLCEDLLAASRRRGAMQELAWVSIFRAWASYDRGALADAEADARWAMERIEGGHLRVDAFSEVIRVLIERDEIDAAEEVVEQLGDPRASSSITVHRFLLARGRLLAAEGRVREALDDFLECGERSAQLGISTLTTAPWRGEAALACAALGDREQARRLAREQLELARAFGRPRMLGLSLRACGLVQRGESGLRLLDEAVHTLERSGSSLELARALADLGAALRRAGRRVQARAQLELALDLAHHCGARRIVNQARAELLAAGARPRRDAITGRDALTAGELRVARLAAEGLTNRELAQALFITTRTAKVHLGSVYRKLGITRRGQLADALAGLLHATRERSSVSEPDLS